MRVVMRVVLSSSLSTLISQTIMHYRTHYLLTISEGVVMHSALMKTRTDIFT